jgi:Hydrazine synthase alpha subunit middle domain
MRRAALGSTRVLAVLVAAIAAPAAAQPIPYPILFGTQTPNGGDFTNIMSTFGTHRGDTDSAPRGGDLWIRYPDGTRRNLTAEAGYGTTAGQEIAVRDPAPHPDGARALFSMVIGGTTQDDYTPAYFQIYEVTGFGEGQAVQIRELPQPADYNNVSPIYGAGDRIFFTSDRPRNGDRRLHPQLDEYETAPTVSGLWSMRADGSELALLDHAPSGDFEPLVDSFGRIVMSRWDHLQRDQQADSDIEDLIAGSAQGYGAVTYESESTDAHHALAPSDEVFPEQREVYGGAAPDPVWDHMEPTEETHTFNQFFPWMAEQDGTGLEILDHLGRHELAGYIAPARTYLEYDGVEKRVDVFLHIAEDPTSPGTYYGIQCPEFGTRSAGQIVSIAAPPGANADTIPVEYVTHPATRSALADGAPADADHIGMFRDPVVLSDGSLWASHTTNVFGEDETVTNPPYPQPYTLSSRNDFAIVRLVPGANGYRAVGERLLATPITKSVSYFDNDAYRIVQYSGPLWELQPIEVRPHPEPAASTAVVPAIESAILAEELGGAGVAMLRTWLRANELALVTSRDVTVRADRQQDFDLKIAWSAHRTAAPGSTPKEIGWLQLLEGRQLRGFHWDGRRVLARPITSSLNPPQSGAPAGAVRLGDDGSMAAFVPARRALSWQTTEPDGTPAVRERYWLTFQPGEIRVCTNCHGVNTHDVFGGPIPQNPPAALRDLVDWWRDEVLPAPEPAPLCGAIAALLTLWSSASRRARG